MPQEDLPQARRGETYGARRQRGRKIKKAEGATAAAEREKAHGPWRKMWEKETGKKYGIATAGAYKTWLAKKRKELAAKKAAGQTAQKQGEAIAPKKKEE
jgi:hypothetical protein